MSEVVQEEEQELKNENVIWSGSTKNGLADGYGKIVWSDGVVYEGTCCNGEPEGDGSITWNNGDVYKGGWKGGLRHGQGKEQRNLNNSLMI